MMLLINTRKLLLTEKEAADLLGYSVRFMQDRRSAGTGPKFIRVSARSIRYRVADLEEWAAGLVWMFRSDPGTR
jgi:predicted DNA-binding transcriptional regulator AlpA